MPAQEKRTARLGLRHIGCFVMLCLILLVSPSPSAGAAVPQLLPEGETASEDIADRVLPEAVPEVLSGDVSVPRTTSKDIEKNEAGWGTLSVALLPEGARTAGARWSADGGKTWRSSGEKILLSEGNATVTFNNLVGWKTPENIPVNISNESGAKAAATYVQLTGSIRTEIDGPEGARWSINGKGEFLSGNMREGLVPGDYTISFSDVVGWLKPQNASVSVSSGAITALSAAYVHAGSVLVTINGPAEARWAIGEELNLASGALIEGLAPGEYTISFSEVAQWNKPEDLAITLTPGAILRAGASYAAKSGSGNTKQTAHAEVETTDLGSTNTGEMIVKAGEEGTAVSSEKETPKEEPASGKTPEAEGGEKEQTVTETPAPETDGDETIIDVDTEDEKENEKEDGKEEEENEDKEETDTPDETDSDLITNPVPSPETGPTPEPTLEPTPEPETDPLPPEVVRPTSTIPVLTSMERARIAGSISAKRLSLDLGDMRSAPFSVFVPAPGSSLLQTSLPANEQAEINAVLADLMTKDADGNDALPFLLQTESFELETGASNLGGKFLVVRITFTVTHSELAAADPKIVSRIEKGIASGRSLGDALLEELHIFKWIGEGDNARCFDLAESVRAGGYSLNSFFEAKAVKNSIEEIFDTKAQDASYTVAFTLLIFDGVTNNPSRLVQPLEGAGIIVFDGLKDGKYADPLILAVSRPKNAQTQGGSSGCATSAGGIAQALLLLPGVLLLLRRRR